MRVRVCACLCVPAVGAGVVAVGPCPRCPGLAGEQLAADVLLIGQSINFVRYCCGDLDWVMDAASVTRFESTGAAQSVCV